MSPDVDPLINGDAPSSPGRGAAPIAVGQLASEILTSGRALQFRVRGVSMRPCIRDGDILEVLSVNERQIRLGDILLINLDGRQLVSHRVVCIDSSANPKSFLLQGDAVLHPDGWFTVDQILGRAVRVGRDRKRINLDNLYYPVFARIYVAGLTIVKSVYTRLHRKTGQRKTD